MTEISLARRGWRGAAARRRVLERLSRVAFADAGEALDEAGRFSAERLRTSGASALVRKVYFHPENAGGGVRAVEFGTPEKALELLGRALSLWGGASRAGQSESEAADDDEQRVRTARAAAVDYSRLGDAELKELERLYVKATSAPGGESQGD